MKKIAIIIVSLLLVLGLAVGVQAASVTTTPQESTSSATEAVTSDGLVYESDVTLPLIVCFFAAVAFIVYGILKIKKTRKNEHDN